MLSAGQAAAASQAKQPYILCALLPLHLTVAAWGSRSAWQPANMAEHCWGALQLQLGPEGLHLSRKQEGLERGPQLAKLE